MGSEALEPSDGGPTDGDIGAADGELLGSPPARAPRSALADRLREGANVPDALFDLVYPPAIRRASARFWTPIVTARRAAQMLTEGIPHARVLDVGAGVGKLCAVGALSTASAEFVGIEQRWHLVAYAGQMLHAFGVRRAEVVQGTLGDVDWSGFDGFYMYNPFAENLYPPAERLDGTIPFSRARFEHDIALVELALARARIGTRLVTYYGFGGAMPSGWRREHAEPHSTGFLDLWVRRIQ